MPPFQADAIQWMKAVESSATAQSHAMFFRSFSETSVSSSEASFSGEDDSIEQLSRGVRGLTLGRRLVTAEENETGGSSDRLFDRGCGGGIVADAKVISVDLVYV